ncbi:putative sodium-coupled neutral amino acid transporter 7 isoform X2 [Hypomesus transpacificus]|uniref:putative sodium-coupled neutral amino acid transporter 7 isoform X2 n=1 Tax=Hypomesus transpacificus TaxID=137520 RepID=UPI001F07665B|nr:putative sodium-coupled neutral amino acid transporter 7 isoform X2 [Hypomesus transpacificus]
MATAESKRGVHTANGSNPGQEWRGVCLWGGLHCGQRGTRGGASKLPRCLLHGGRSDSGCGSSDVYANLHHQWTGNPGVLLSVIAAMSHDPESVVSKTWYTDRKFTIVVTGVLVILPLSIPKEIGFQKYASALSVVGTWYVTIVVIVKYIWPDKEMTPGYIPTSPSSWTAVLNAIPTICFGFQCHVSSVPVFNSMSRSEIKPWGGVVTFGMIICLFVYTGTGVCGFLSFGSNVSQDVLMSYPPNDIAVAIARAFIVVCVVTSYPILHFCGRAVLEGLWLRFHGEQVELCVRREQRRRVLQTLLWFTVTLILALFIPDIGRVIALIGGLAACFIFVFPGLCLIQAKLSETENRSASWHGMVVYGVVMVTIGAFIFGQTTANAIYQDISNHS